MAVTESGENYAGDISVEQAFEMLSNDENVVLIDVRTQAEWAFVGAPDLSTLGKETVFVSWQVFPTMERNSGFAEELANQGVTADKTALFSCRSGQRSMHAAAAMAAVGCEKSFNVAHGFEGPLDESGHRGTAEGWKAKRLPWVQR